jgi:hypothetical protein
MMAEKLFLDASIKNHLAPVLRKDGFKGSGKTFRAVTGDMVCVVNIQASSFGMRFFVNLAVQPLTVPDLEGETVDPRKVLQQSCEFRRRLSESGVDQSWDYSDQATLDRAVIDAARLYEAIGRDFFARFTAPDGDLRKITPESELPSGYAASLCTSEARLFRALAYLSLSADKVDDAARFARRVLIAAGPSWQPYEDLQELIQRAQK